MNKKDQKSIRSNLNLLAAKTVHVDELVEALQRMELIESDEINHIKTQPTKYKRCTEIYLLMLRKGPDAFDSLHQALVETKNDVVADILKPDEVIKKKPPLQRIPSQIEVDIPVQEAHVKSIVNIMEFTIAHAEWPVIVSDLLDESARKQLDLLPSTTPFEILFEKTLQLWIATRGPAATFNALLKILDDRSQAETAEALKDKYRKIFS